MSRTLLIVDDIIINRAILKNILKDEYEVLEAEDGQAALELMEAEAEQISAVLLDLSMPVMDGFAVLERMSASRTLSALPVIVMTALTDSDTEERALRLGAKDYISKPYNPAIIRQRIRNTISLRETAAAVNALQRDRLTRLYNRERFFEKVSELVREHEAGYYIMACCDIAGFKIINDQYGTQKGDEVLCHVANALKEGFKPNGGFCCRIAGDDFAILYPASFQNSPEIEKIRQRASNVEGLISQLSFSVGRYVVSDLSVSASSMFDRASIAENSVKGRFDRNVAYYDESMRERLLSEQNIVTQMESALKECQFEVWFQPQYNHTTGALIGSEALVRWRHPENGLISPGIFIPVFERNGFIYELDKYVWESVCAHLKKWTDAGLSPLPVSVNISRYDIFKPELVDLLTGLLEKYSLPVELLRLEITESAFSESSKQIVSTAKELVARGFTVEIDDFGSGYSSLNTLKNVPAQVVKLDMRFLEDDDDSERGGNIIESIVRMTKWLGMTVIAEGVESTQQADFLKSIGCCYVQGYLYARPMPAAEFEEHFKKTRGENVLMGLETVENLDNNAFWDPKSLDTLIFNSYVGGACIFEYHNGKSELLRINDKYAQVFGANISAEKLYRTSVTDFLDGENLEVLKKNIENAIETGSEASCETVSVGIYGIEKPVYIRSTVRVIAHSDDRYLIYGTVTNITAQREAELKQKKAYEQLSTLMRDMPGGFVKMRVFPDGSIRPLYFNEGFFALTGMGYDELMELYATDAMAGVHPEDVGIVRQAVAQLLEKGEAHSQRYRLRHGRGGYAWIMFFGRATRGEDGKEYLNIYYTDASEQARAEELQKELLDNLPYGVALYEFDGTELTVIHLNKRYWEMVDRQTTEYTDSSCINAVHPDDRAVIFRELTEAIRQGTDVACDIRIICGDDEYRSFHIVGRIVRKRGENYSIYASYTPIPKVNSPALLPNGQKCTLSYSEMAETGKMKSRLELLTKGIPGGVATYEYKDERLSLIYFNDGFCELFELSREECLALHMKNVFVGVFKEDVPVLQAQLKAILDRNATADCVCRVHLKGGGHKFISVRGARHDGADGHVYMHVMLLDVTARQEATEKLRISEEENRLAVESSRTVVCRYVVATKTLITSPNIKEWFGIGKTIEDVPYGEVREGKISPETVAAYTAFYESIISGEKSGETLYQRHSTVGWRWVKGRFATIFADNGKPVSAVIAFSDETESFEKDAAYKKWRQGLTAKTPDTYSLFRCNISKQTFIDAEEGTLLNNYFKPGFDFDGRAAEYAASCVLPEDSERFMAFLKADALLAGYYQGQFNLSMDYREKQPESSYRWLRLTVDLVEYSYSSDVEAYLLFEDIDSAKRRELSTIERAETDPLTGLMNRAAFAARVSYLIDTAKPNSHQAMMMMDIDGFKKVNDVFGHGAGDQTLVDVAQSLRSVLRHGDLVGRLGGDEFAVFMSDIPGDAIAANKAKQICAMTRKSYSAEVEISASIGIVVSPRDGTSFESLYSKADAAMYHVKDGGKNNYAFYDDEMADDQSGAERKVSERTPHQRKKKRRILIVDDNQMDQAIMTNLFVDDFIVEKAKDGMAALIRMRHYGSALSAVLLDLVMPGMGGIDVLKQMQESEELRTVPAIIVSSDSDRETSLKAIRAGATDFVTKPIDPDMLRIRVQSAIDKAENERMLAQNSFLEYQSNEVKRYKTVLERNGIIVIEHDWVSGRFTYDPLISSFVLGKYDDRNFWHILLTDMVTDTMTVKRMQELVHAMAADRKKDDESMLVKLKSPTKELHWFRVCIYKVANEYGLTGKIYLTFCDLGEEMPRA